MGFEDSICNTTLTLSLGSSPARRTLAGGPRPPPPPSEMKFEVQEDDGNSNSMASSFSNSSMKRERDQIGGGGGDDEAEKESPKGFSGDDDEVVVGTRKKLRLTKDQSVVLEDSFKEHSTLNSKQKDHLARRLNLRPRQVEVWFQNRRARNKLKQTEVDCELLRKCYDNLTDENRRLQRELQELKSKTTPFYMQLSAATPLTMCPSCQRTYGGSGEHSAANNSLSSIGEKSHYYSSKQNGTIAF